MSAEQTRDRCRQVMYWQAGARRSDSRHECEFSDGHGGFHRAASGYTWGARPAERGPTVTESATNFGDFATGAQYPDRSKDGIEHFCKKCAPAAERMFIELVQAKQPVPWPVVLLALNRLLAERYAGLRQRWVVGVVREPVHIPEVQARRIGVLPREQRRWWRFGR